MGGAAPEKQRGPRAQKTMNTTTARVRALPGGRRGGAGRLHESGEMTV